MTTIGGIAVEANKYAAFTGSLTQNLNANNFNISGVKTLSATNVSGLLTTGVQSHVTGLGPQAQNLDMNNFSIVNAGTISTGISPLGADLNCNQKALTNASSISATNIFGSIQTGSQPAITSIGPQSGTLNMNAKSIVGIGHLSISNPNMDEISTTLANGNINLRPNGTGHVNVFKNLDMQSHRVINLPAPTADNDAARRSYVDGVLANSKEAGTLTGDTLAIVVKNSSLQNLGTQNAALNMGTSNRIINLAAPTDNADAATKAYADTVANNARDANSLSGTTLRNLIVNSSLRNLGEQNEALDMGSQNIVNLANPSINTDAATKAYVDNAANANNLTGTTLKNLVVNSSLQNLGTQNAALNMGTSNRIINLAAPTDNADAATKAYADTVANNARAASGLTGDTLPGLLFFSSIKTLGEQGEDLNMGGFKVANMGAPTANTQAATKLYVDTAANTAKQAINLLGDTLAGNVVNSSISKLGTMQFDLNMGFNAIVGPFDTNINISPVGTGVVSINGGLRMSNVTSPINTNITITPNGTGTVVLQKDLNMNFQNISNVINLQVNQISTITNSNLILSPAGSGIVSIQKNVDLNFQDITNVGTLSTTLPNMKISSDLSMEKKSISQVSTISGTSSPAADLNIQTSGTSKIVMNNELNMSNKNIGGVDTISVSTLFGRTASGIGFNGRAGGLGFYSDYGNNYFKPSLPNANSIVIDGDAGYQKSIHFQNGNSTKWQMGMNSIDNTSGNWFLYDSTLGVNLFEFAQAGAPTTNYRLPRLGTLDGTVQAYTISGAAGYLRVASSDRRIKQNEAFLDSSKSLEKIINLKPKSFDYAAHYPGKPDVGFIAQELEQYIPEAVDGKKFEYEFQRERGEPGKDGALIKDADGNPLLDYSQPRYRTVREMPILSTLVSAVQELEKRNRVLEERVAELHEIVAEFVSEFVPNKRQRV